MTEGERSLVHLLETLCGGLGFLVSVVCLGAVFVLGPGYLVGVAGGLGLIWLAFRLPNDGTPPPAG